ncbi:TIGR03643 family protein [Planctomycetaceae bacterium SH139]
MNELTRGEMDRIIMMAWEDRTSFEAIRTQFGLTPGEVIKLMRRELSVGSFKLWRKRTYGRSTKHEQKFARGNPVTPLRFRAKSQRG